MKDYYAILQISPNADPEVIEAAYRRLARKYHPDVHSGADATERMRELNEAYEVLGDPSRRAEYDASLGRARGRSASAGPEQQRTPPPQPPPPPPSGGTPEAEGPGPKQTGPKRPRIRLFWVALAGVLLALAAAGAGAAAIIITSGQAPEEPVTQVYRYAPSVGAAVLPPSEDNGCWTGSLATARNDALRCSVGHAIHDPCFTLGPNTVVCPGDPRTPADDVAFTADVPVVPYAEPSRAGVWFMVVNGQGCRAITGTAPFIAGKSFPFACDTFSCTPPLEGPEGFLSDCWRSDSGQERTYTVDAVWY